MRTFCCAWYHSLTTPFSSSSSSMPPPAARSASSPTTGICGVLHKWVNYGKGWRPRWFVLQDGVLSYFKIHGPDPITLNQDTERGFNVIGYESSRIISQGILGCNTRTPLGEIHLKVSSIRESKSDDKRFWLFTGTKRLHLRADTPQDRAAWTEALQAVKDMFPRVSNSELMAPVDTTVVSTEKMRQRLAREGASEAAIRDSEQIVRNEFAALHKQLLVHKKKQWVIVDTLRHLEVHLINTRKRKQNALPVQNSSSSLSAAAHDGSCV